jgi:predicted transcriptional regulator
MAISRKNEFPNKNLKLAEFAKALSHPARVAILEVLAKKQKCICGDLVIELPLAQSTVSQHLKALKEIGLIQGEVDGPCSNYCIDWKVLEKYQKLMSQWSHQISKLKKVNSG